MTAAEALVEHAATSGKPFASSIACLPHRFRPGAAPLVRMQVNLAASGPEPGNWLVIVDSHACRVFAGSVAEPDARLYTDSDIGHAIISGDLSVDEALDTGLLDYDGDETQLARLRACFDFGGSL
jgi:hypothetical protein